MGDLLAVQHIYGMEIDNKDSLEIATKSSKTRSRIVQESIRTRLWSSARWPGEPTIGGRER